MAAEISSGTNNTRSRFRKSKHRRNDGSNIYQGEPVLPAIREGPKVRFKQRPPFGLCPGDPSDMAEIRQQRARFQSDVTNRRGGHVSNLSEPLEIESALLVADVYPRDLLDSALSNPGSSNLSTKMSTSLTRSRRVYETTARSSMGSGRH